MVCAAASEPTAPFGPVAARRVRRFFGTEPTPLVPMRQAAKDWGLAGVYVKDESKRLGQQAFKVFGTTYAMATLLAKRLEVDLDDVKGLEDLQARYSAKFGGSPPTTFVTCTDGNHGRAVAWAAKQLGQRAVVYMPKGSAQARVDHVRGHGGECTVTELNYDQTVELAFQRAKEHGWTVLQDTTAPGYTEIPTWIMQGYTAMADEALEQIQALDGGSPTHVLLQVGVGSMAGAVLGYLVEKAGDGKRPVALTLEPKNAACAFESAKRGDGEMATVDGDLESMIAGLCCGVPSELGWPILAKHVDGGYCWIEDSIAGNGMRAMAKEGVEAGECGGAGVGLLGRLMDPACETAARLRKSLGLDDKSKVLIFNTEGATDPENYKKQIALADVPTTPGDFGFAPPVPAEGAQRASKRPAGAAVPEPTAPFGPVAARRVRRFFGTEPTPLVPMRQAAKDWGLAGVYVKDESKRLGQQAFKVFGATYAMATLLAKRLEVDLDDVKGLEDLQARYSAKFGGSPTTFVTCTDGNHGRAVAWAAKQLGQRAVVYMPKGSAQARVDHVRGHGGECTVTELNYDQTVELAFQRAKEHGWTVLQDTTAPGYTEIPTWIMQGYTAMADEALEQIQALDGGSPTHVLLQVGVGSMAGAVLGYLVEKAGDGKRPVALTLEPKNAACAFESAKRGDGEMATVDGDLESMIAGLCCGVPSELGWPILAKHVDGGYCWIEDSIAGNGMRAMAKEGVEAGECGGAGVGLLGRLMDLGCETAARLRKSLGLDDKSKVLIFNTEGATDPENYKKQIALADVPTTPGDFGFAPPVPAEGAQRASKRLRSVL